MQPNWRKRWYRIGLIAGSLLMLYQLWDGWQATRATPIQIVNPTGLAVALALMLAAVSLQLAAWLLIMRGLGIALPLLPSLSGYMLSSITRYMPGGVWGYVSRSQWLFQDHAIPYAYTHLGSGLEFLGFVMSAAAFSLVYVGEWVPSALLIAILLAIGVVSPILWLFRRQIRDLLKFRLDADANRMAPTIGKLSPAYWLAAMMAYGMFWTCQGGALLEIGRALQTTTQGTLFSATAVYAVACLAGLLAVFVPAGIGVRETVLSGLLAGSANGASIVSIIMRITTMTAEVVSVACWWVLAHLSRRIASR